MHVVGVCARVVLCLHDDRSGKLYSPPGNSTLLVFLEDLNVPMTDAYGTQSTAALLRQLIDYSGWYDRSDRTFKELSGVRVVAAMNPAAVSTAVTPRLLVRLTARGIVMEHIMLLFSCRLLLLSVAASLCVVRRRRWLPRLC